MALEVQNQQPQPLQQVHVSGGHDRGIATGWSQAGVCRAAPVTLDLFHTSHPSSHKQSKEPCPLPLSWQKLPNLKRSLEDTKMSRRNGNSPKLDLKLNLSPPRANPHVESPSRSATISPPTSCVSSELNQEETPRYSSSPEATSMVLVGCPRCLMYVMLAEEDPRCPKCKSTVLLDVLHENTATKTKDLE